VVEDIDVQLALATQPGEGEIAAPKESHSGVIDVVAMEEVQLGVKRLAQEQPDLHFAGTKLPNESAKAPFIGIGGGTEGQLVAELLSNAALQTRCGLKVNALTVRVDAE